MSVVEYRFILYQFGEEIDWQTQRRKLIFILRAFLPDCSEEGITDIDSLLSMLEEKNILGIDRLNVMKDLLKGIRKWDLLRRVERFEMKRKDYKQLLEQISRALDESNELQRLISICRGKNLIALEREEDIADVNAMFTILEQQNKLGIEDLTLLKTLANEMEKPDLCTLLEEFEKKRKQEEDAEREREEREDNIRKARAQATSVLSGGINIGERLIGVVTPHCTFRNAAGSAVVVTTWMVLRRSPSMEEFVNAFKEAVLPLGNCLRAISEGSIRFTLQAENISALEALWQRYQNETLQTEMQKFLVTEEIKQLAGGEVTLTVHIDEEEYRNAMCDFIRSGTEERSGREQRGLKDRASSESDLSRMQGLVSEDGKDFAQVRKFMSFAEKIRVEEFLENRQETNSTITRTSDSGVGTWSPAPTECRSEEGAEGSRKEKFDHVEEWVTEAIENLDNVLSELKTTTQSEVVLRVSVKQAKQELEKSREKIHNWNESGYEIPVADSKMALVFGEVEEYIFSPELSAEGVLQKVKTILQINQDMFEHPNEDVKKLIRLVAKTAKKLNRIDVFDHLREYAPPGTTGPRLSDDSTFADIPLQTARKLTMALSGKDEWTMIVEQLGLTPKEILFLKRRTTNPADAALAYVSQKLMISVGSLYDLLNENRLPMLADFL